MRVGIERIGSIAMWLVLLAGLWAPGAAAAQDPDMREIFPYVMLVIDTSGSMEYQPSCVCKTPGCTECLPECDPGSGLTPDKNRWAVTLEALTGRFRNFGCEELPRTATFGATYDAGYFLPYHQPWNCRTGDYCPLGSGNEIIDQESDGILDQYVGRMYFGLMTFDGWDTYKGAPPLIEPPGPSGSGFDVARSEARDGLWSYGGFKTFRYPGCKNDYAIDTGVRSAKADEGSLVSLNSCSGGGPKGTAACPSWCTTCDSTEATLNTDIQEALLSARPYGGTPIAAALDDLYFHFQDLQRAGTDAFGNCRNRFALLVTDGRPDADYRDLNCQCGQSGTAPDRCMPPGEPLAAGDPIPLQFAADDMRCPYPTPEEAARALVRGRTGSGGVDEAAMIERLFVIGLSVSDTDVLDRLNDIAEAGCTEDDCAADEHGNAAFFADDFDTLVQNLSTVLEGFSKPISRSIPAYGIPNRTDGAPMKQFQISTGFKMPEARLAPRTGVIERTRFTCSTDGQLKEEEPDPDRRDLFAKELNEHQKNDRDIWTAVPFGQSSTGWSTITTTSAPNSHLWKDESSCGTDGCVKVNLRSITPVRFGTTVTSGIERDKIYNWTLGDVDPNVTGDTLERFQEREKARLGDIYHSSPVIVAAPRFDSADEGFNRFRQRPEIAHRPQMLYINTNDGLLHAFHLEKFVQASGTERPEGYEEWAFVPPLLIDRLEENINGHQITLDGTPVVKNVFLSRTNRADPTSANYRTVLITGMRGGGKGYVALDVTDPMKPKFLWQFTDTEMGYTFGQAALGQAVYTFTDENGGLPQEGAVAILPGGVGEIGAEGGECANGVTNPSMHVPSSTEVFETAHLGPGDTTPELFDHREEVRCWRKQGRALYFVEVETGRLIKKLYLETTSKRMFPSPIVSAPAIYPADIGSLMTEAFVTDADGVIWRIDMRSNDQKATLPLEGWTARPFHDMFYDRAPSDGELTYEAPLLSVNDREQVVVIVGSGDTNNFVKTKVHNRVVSLTEEFNPDSAIPLTDPRRFRARLNWEMRFGDNDATPRFAESELVTGAMALFNGQLFFSTFIAVNPGGDVCDMGKGRIHVVDYIHPDARRPNQSEPASTSGGRDSTPETYPPLLVQGIEVPSGGTTSGVINVTPGTAKDNLMLVGLTLTQRPSCKTTGTDDSIWDDQLYTPSEVNDPSVYLVAQGSGDDSALLKSQLQDGLRRIDVRLNKPSTFSRVVSWATSVD